MSKEKKQQKNKRKGFSKQLMKSFASHAKKYLWWIIFLIVVVIAVNLMNLAIPRITGDLIDTFDKQGSIENIVLIGIGGLLISLFGLRFLQSILSWFVARSFARDIRDALAEKISKQSFAYINKVSHSKLLTNFTSDVDEIKTLVSQGLVQIFASLVLIVGSAILMFTINWKLALLSLSIIPVVVFLFQIIFARIGKMFKKSREVIDGLNRIIGESVVGAALVRVLFAFDYERTFFNESNKEARKVGIQILSLFGSLVPLINFLSSASIVIIVWFGGRDVIEGVMTVGEFTAFYGYLSSLVFPIIILGFISNSVARSFVSYGRIYEVLSSKVVDVEKGVKDTYLGAFSFKNVSLSLGGRTILKNISFDVAPGTRTAIIGPTAAGKTQIMYLLAGLRDADDGEILFDGKHVSHFDREHLFSQIGLVFQDHVIFNASIKENVTFNEDIDPDLFEKALETAEIDRFVSSLSEGLDTRVSERGDNLSGGQKQRLSLARALAQNPKLLLLDDFTARVDFATEKRILDNIKINYPKLTMVSITQKIASIEDFDRIIFVIRGEIVAQGTHKELMEKSFEYKQLYLSQQSTEE